MLLRLREATTIFNQDLLPCNRHNNTISVCHISLHLAVEEQLPVQVDDASMDTDLQILWSLGLGLGPSQSFRARAGQV